MSGTWEDDAKNWKRVFGSHPPQGVTVVHSKYVRYPHFTYEASYFFELRLTPEEYEQLFTRNDFTQVDARTHDVRTFGTVPEWFAPKPRHHYEIYVYRDNPMNFVMLVDPTTGAVYWSDYQI